MDELGVPTASVFFEHDHVPAQAHEYKFDLASAEGRHTFDAMLSFPGRRAGQAPMQARKDVE